jgi:DNA-binding response OmpR family regulator
VKTDTALAERRHEFPAVIDGIDIVRWPEESGRADNLVRAHMPCLFVVAADADEPALTPDDPLTDWVREPVIERELHNRVVALRSAASVVRPMLDDHGVLWRGNEWIALSPIEARLTTAFLATPGSVLDRKYLEAVGWSKSLDGSRALDARIKVLRPRVEPAGLLIHTVRGQGYLAEIV